MSLKNNKKADLFIYIFFILIFVTGISVYKDYGLTLDDEIYRKNGEFYYYYIIDFFSGKQLPELKSLIKTAPVLFELPLVFLSKLFHYDQTKQIYELSHIVNFIIFYVPLIFLYKLIYKKFKSKIYAAIGVLGLIISPRIFAESFYNSRDIFFLSLIIFNLYAAYNFLNNSNFKNLLYFSFTSALVVYAKVIGIVPPILFLFLYFLNNLKGSHINKKILQNIFLIIFLTFFFIYCMWPYLWTDPINNFLYSFKLMTKAQNEILVLNYYLGDFYSSISTPWHYRIVWFLFTTPVFILFFAIIGFILLSFHFSIGFLRIADDKTNPWKNNNEMFDFYLLLNLIFITFLASKFNTSVSGGWRHLYFLYPILIIISLIGLEYFLNLKFKKIYNFLILILAVSNILYISIWSYKFHPHQNVYFNLISKKFAKKNFDLDYWGLSNIHVLRHILEKNDFYPIKVSAISFTSLYESVLLLNDNDKKKFIIEYNPNNADFIIDNYIRKIRKNFIVDNKTYTKYFEIIVDEIPINTVYKKNK